jgi:hypothetical protein
MPPPARGASAPSARRRLLGAAFLAWAVLVGAGGWAFLRYAYAAGDPGRPPVDWPSGSALPRAAERPTLVIFLHPRCPCSRVSLAELAWTLDRCPAAPAVRAVLAVPPGASDGWACTPLADEAARLAAVSTDGGREAGLFGARTSGHVLLFAADGRRLFTGGITDGRGQRGPSLGREALLTALRDGAAPAREAPVFGCPLFPDTDP